VRLVPLTAAVALLSLGPATPAPSQHLSTVRAGQRVRITTTKRERLIGALRVIAGDTLIVAAPAERGAGVAELTVPPTQVGVLEVSRTGPRRSRALQGLVVGLAAGAALGYMLTANASCSGCDNPGMIGVVLVAPLGAIAGLVVGVTASRERWTRVAWPVSSGSAAFTAQPKWLAAP
jgi:hypothetical protein